MSKYMKKNERSYKRAHRKQKGRSTQKLHSKQKVNHTQKGHRDIYRHRYDEDGKEVVLNLIGSRKILASLQSDVIDRFIEDSKQMKAMSKHADSVESHEYWKVRSMDYEDAAQKLDVWADQFRIY